MQLLCLIILLTMRPQITLSVFPIQSTASESAKVSTNCTRRKKERYEFAVIVEPV